MNTNTKTKTSMSTTAKSVQGQRAVARLATRWGAGLAMAAAASTWSAAPALAGLFSSLSEADEIKAGQQVAAQAQKEYGRALPASDPMSRRVAAIGRKFAALSTRKGIPFSYTVLQNDKVLNAFAAPGGPIFVTTRLIRTTSNDAELAYVLGHETGHIEQKHIVKSMKKQQRNGLLAGAAGILLGRKVDPNIANAIASAGLQVVQSGYSRKDESEADAVGVRFMSRLGYDPRAALTMLQKLGEEGGGKQGGIDKYLATHPAPESRIKAVSAQIQKESLVDVARRSGGPRLSDNSSYSNAGGSSSGGYSNASDQYPDDYTTPSRGSSNSSSSDSYPDYGADSLGNTGTVPRGNVTSATGGSGAAGTVVAAGGVDLGGPLRLVQNGDSSVILAPAAGVARWAGARATQKGNTLTLQRKGRSLELRRYSTAATLNGQAQSLSVAPDVFNGRLYAPLGSVVEALGGTATFDEAANAVRLRLDGRESLVYLPR